MLSSMGLRLCDLNFHHKVTFTTKNNNEQNSTFITLLLKNYLLF